MAADDAEILVHRILAVDGNYKAQESAPGKPFPNVQNLGLPAGQVAVRHKKGGYHQFAVRAEQDVPPLLTHLRVAEAVRSFEAGDLGAAAAWLTVKAEFEAHGLSIPAAALCLWLDIHTIPVPERYRRQSGSLPESLRARLLLTRRDTIPFPLSIAAIGSSNETGTSVVPEEWLGRRFDSGQALCRAIDTLPHRQGFPEATYCCHYGLKRVPEPSWMESRQVPAGLNPAYGISLRAVDGVLQTSARQLTPETAGVWIAAQPESVRFIFHGDPEADSTGILFACDRDALFEPVPVCRRTNPAGVLSSRLQKAIRRGRGAAAVLEQTVEELRLTPVYTLPDDHFRRTSGSRQLAWRLFVSIFEDAAPYTACPEGSYLSLPDLVALGLLAHAAPELQFNPWTTDQILRTALRVQADDAPGRNWDWRKGGKRTPITGSSEIEQACRLALEWMPMMERDAEMLRQGCECIALGRFTPLPLPARPVSAPDPAVEEATLRASYDFHSNPAILLHLQASLPGLPAPGSAPGTGRQRRGSKKREAELVPTTQNLKRWIWENSSRLNTRNPHHVPEPGTRPLLAELEAIQASLLHNSPAPLPERQVLDRQRGRASGQVDPRVGRAAFLSLFGQSVELPVAGPESDRRLRHAFVAVLAGSVQEPCKIKKPGKKQATYLSGDEQQKGQEDFVDFCVAIDGLEVELPPPPAGCRWRLPAGTSRVRLRILRTAAPHEPDVCPLTFSVEGMSVPAFDASPLLELLSEAPPMEPTGIDRELVARALHLAPARGQWELNQQLRRLAQQRRQAGEPDLDWVPLAERSPVAPVVWQRACTKLLSLFQGRVRIGPVDRHGDQLYEAVDYLHEGTLWRIFNLLAFACPQTVVPAGDLDFQIHTDTAGHVRLLRDLERLGAPFAVSGATDPVPRIRTPLWQHQAASVERVSEELLRNGRKGFGDASDVGAGKTLTSLAVCERLVRHNEELGDASAEAFLVLVYNAALVQTWKEEIHRHTEGFHFVTQDASGTLSEPIGRHSILVTTLGRMRDHPVTRRWHLVVIDECLSVQNASALWTQEAWKQVSCSQRGVLLLSATFFRSRFNELFYLLRMLRTGLPESRPYLDAILSESITCHLPENTPWRWTEETRLLPLEPGLRDRYERLRSTTGQPAERLYGQLDALLVREFDLAPHLDALLAELGPQSRALVFARSREEAERLAKSREDLGLFPDITRQHVVTTTAVAARGVNTLTGFDVLVTRPVEPDLVPQMRGRLARPGQQNNQLRWIWMVASGTLEEAKLERNRLAERFHNDHIMPLAQLYRRALGL